MLAFIGLGLAGCAATGPGGPSAAPPTSETAAPSPSSEGPTFADQVEALRIPEGLSDEDLAKTILERQEAWANYGKSVQLVNESVEANLSWENFLVIKAEENAQIFAAALLPEDWHVDPALKAYYEASRDYNYVVLLAYVRTAWNGDEVPENVEGFKTDFIFETATLIEAPAGQRGLVIDFTEDWNDENNTLEPIETPWHSLRVTFSTVNGHVEVTSAVITVRYTR